MQQRRLVDKLDYVLVILGVMTVLVYGIGLIFFGVVAWRIGTKMESMSENVDAVGMNDTEEIDGMNETIEESRDTFKLEEYSEITLEDGK